MWRMKERGNFPNTHTLNCENVKNNQELYSR